ncbi:MAG: DUF190 domain-containing protein [Sulfuricellaceae bacterium]|nr:DUF190 domain-containing protein [Sulfuricellaceae bacterium]
MQGICLKLYVSELQRHDGRLIYEWLLERARTLDIPGGTAIRAIAGFGRHGRLHEEAFFELAGELPVEVSFLLNEAQCEQVLAAIKLAGLRLFYVRLPAEFGVTP